MNKFDKKKKREKEVKKKLDARRSIIRTQAKEEREKERERREVQRAANRIEGKTIKTRENREEVISQLAHNYEILEAIQKEQDALEARKTEPQEGGKLSASADVVFTPKKEENNG